MTLDDYNAALEAIFKKVPPTKAWEEAIDRNNPMCADWWIITRCINNPSDIPNMNNRDACGLGAWMRGE